MSALTVTLSALLAAGQMHDMADMPGMRMPATSKPARSTPAPRQRRATRAAPPARPATSRPPAPAEAALACPPEHAAMGHCTPPAPVTAAACPPEHAAMGHCTSDAAEAEPAAGTDQPAGHAAPPVAPTTRAAARFYDPVAMARADRMMRDMHGGMRFSQVIFNLAEAQVKAGRDGYRWDGEGWFGGDIDRLVVKTEGEGGVGTRVDTAEVQALYARAIDPYWNLQLGVRQDLGAGARRRYAVVGVEGLAPYWFDVEGALFLSDHGDVLARGEAWYDQRITQRAILQPRVEVNLAAQDIPSSRIGAGLSSAEVGVRLRYEIRREFAPYIGLSWERRYGATARYARDDGERTGGVALALGVRAWF
ncbi:copper resistance protein B [uncultured Sphingomonas sp.]|uniref:copper resistance protein B n=1 Tax=uncultured Sphingomonas sp. TaxID=158754 RepID=UPI0025EA1522|nr:copper resistance protein B [uncultured Sphingomonas sp.]